MWYADNFLVLHISLWWIATVLLAIYLAERSPGHKPSTGRITRNQLCEHLRLNALFEGNAAWFVESVSENLNEDMPIGGPLVRSICLRMPARWQLDRFETSLGQHTQSATFGSGELPRFEVDFGEWAIGWRISAMNIKNATKDEVRGFLQDLHRVLETTDGITSVRWYRDEMLQGGQMTESDYRLGTTTPMESPTTGT